MSKTSRAKKSKLDGPALMYGPVRRPELAFDAEAVRAALKESRLRKTVRVRCLHD